MVIATAAIGEGKNGKQEAITMKKQKYIWAVTMIALLAACQQQEQEQAKASAVKAQSAADTSETKAQNDNGGMQEAATKMADDTAATASSANEAAVVEAMQEAAPVPAKEMATEPAATESAAGNETTTALEQPAQPVASAGDAAKGAKIAKGKCSSCHYFDKDQKKVGPPLMGIYKRTPSIEGLPFAQWDDAALDQWLTSPKAVKSNTKMAFKGIAEKSKRDDVIAYLKTL